MPWDYVIDGIPCNPKQQRTSAREMDWAGFSDRCRAVTPPRPLLQQRAVSRGRLGQHTVAFTPPYQLLFVQDGHTFTTSTTATRDSQSGNMPPATPNAMSLQQSCRRTILRALTVKRVDKVQELPLPNALKKFISSFRVPEDFDTDGFHMNYNFHFPNHPHHKTHRVHPAVSKFDGSKVLIKAQNTGETECSVCAMLGERLVYEQESGAWAAINHPHLQRCYTKMVDEINNVTCFILEYPLISLKDLVIQLSFGRSFVPEFLLWDTIAKVSSALIFMQSENLQNELFEPQHFVLDIDGQIKIENLLLYLPSQVQQVRYRTGIPNQRLAIYTAPEIWQGNNRGPKTLVWYIGCVFYELATLTPAFLLETYTVKVNPLQNHQGPQNRFNNPNQDLGLQLRPRTPPPLPEFYSSYLARLISTSLSDYPEARPSLENIFELAKKMVKQQQPSYRGPRTLLDLVPGLRDATD